MSLYWKNYSMIRKQHFKYHREKKRNFLSNCSLSRRVRSLFAINSCNAVLSVSHSTDITIIKHRSARDMNRLIVRDNKPKGRRGLGRPRKRLRYILRVIGSSLIEQEEEI